jgi:hypothetical protein
MSTIGFVAIAIIIVFASIVYEFIVISRFIAEQMGLLQPPWQRSHPPLSADCRNVVPPALALLHHRRRGGCL